MRVRAIVAYDGTDYAGFQRQVEVPTVQEELEKALKQTTQVVTSVVAAGRTDAGVHAAGQVVAFATSWRHTLEDLRRAMNAVLPRDIGVLAVEEVESDFHPRFDARRRHYRYRVFNAPIRWPLSRRYSLHVPYPLDLGAMDEAARTLVGEHDFATFGQPPKGSITVRQVFRAEWSAEPGYKGPFGSDPGEGTWLTFDIEANAFLYRMVRSLVGTMLDVGQARMSLVAFKEAFASCDRSRAGQTVGPQGLCLIKVTY